MSHLLVDGYATEHAGGRVCWIGDVQQHRLRVSNCSTKLDVGQYYGVPVVGETATIAEAIENDYAIENRIAEVKQRVKQSVFRQRVLENFGGKCCVSGLTEPDLLIASHIVPWAARTDSRLDPANGLCLAALYDALLDAGYFTLTENLTVDIATIMAMSEPLQTILDGIDGIQIHRPKIALRPEYLAYHRENVFQSSAIIGVPHQTLLDQTS